MQRAYGNDRPLTRWTYAREMQLCELWATGELSARQIGERMGVNKNVIIGKIHRLGLARKSAAEISAARSKNVLAIAEKRRERAAMQLERTKEAVARAEMTAAERRERQAAAARAAIAKVELTLIDNPAFVAKVEKPADLYAHLRSEEGLSRALLGLSR